MTRFEETLSRIKRPAILLRAARVALDQHNHRNAIFRLFGEVPPIGSDDLFALLLEQEEYMNTQRKTGEANYSIARHILVLTALLHECRSSRT